MSSVKKWMVGLTAGAAVVGSVSAVAESPVLSIDRQSQTVQTPSSPKVGFSYVPAGGGNSSELAVYTEGFLFCGNPGGGNQTMANLIVKHQDHVLNPPAEWLFSKATDLPGIIYTGGVLAINSSQETSLTCLGTEVNGAVTSGLREGIFDNGYDSATGGNYSHLVNWVPQSNFDWTSPDWTEVPQDPCYSTSNDPAVVDEDVACAALTGVRVPSGGSAVRAGTIWTANDFVSFTYLFRVDARFGPQPPSGPTHMALPQQAAESPNAGSQVALTVYDAFDSTYLNTSGQACLLTQPPATLTSNVCNGQSPVTLQDGLLKLPVTVGQPPLAQVSSSFYVAVTRPLRSGAGHGSNTTPVVGAAILVEGAVAREGGDKFTGDNIAFGFQPAVNSGFPWMKELPPQ